MIRYRVIREREHGEHSEYIWSIWPFESTSSLFVSASWGVQVRTFAEVPDAVAECEARRLAALDGSTIRSRPLYGILVRTSGDLIEQPFQTWEQAALFLEARRLRAAERSLAALLDSLLERTSDAA